KGQPLAAAHADDLLATLGEAGESLRRRGVRSLAIIPLVAGGKSLGALTFSTRRIQRDWPEYLLSLLQLLGQVYANLLAQRATEVEVQQNRGLADLVLASLGAPVAVLDRQGTVLLVNSAWHQIAQENGAPLLADVAPGTNYLEVCQKAAGGATTEL